MNVVVTENSKGWYLKPFGKGLSQYIRGITLPKTDIADEKYADDMAGHFREALLQAYQAGYDQRGLEVRQALGIAQ